MFYIHMNRIPRHEYDKVISFISAYKPSDNIDYLLETYLVYKLLQTEKEFSDFKDLKSNFKNDLDKFPNSIFEIDYNDINVFYRDSFWELALFLNRLNYDDADKFETYITNNQINVICLESSSKLIQLFPSKIKKNFLSYPTNIEFFLTHQSGKYINSPNGLLTKLNVNNQDINDLAKRYCESERANPNYLQSIVDYKKKSQFYFEDTIKLLSKRTIDQFWEKHFNTNEGISYYQKVSIEPLSYDQVSSFKTKGISYEITINKNILDENHDFPTLLNHFIYIFNFFDYDTGLPWLELNQEHINLERLFSSQSNADYVNLDKKLKEQYSLLFFAYFEYLKNNNIDIEEIVEWYFNFYVKEELGIQGFYFHSSNNESSYYERGKSLIGEMDSILDQYEIFSKNEEIDPELLEIRSRSASYNILDSFKEKKFIKLKTNDENSRLLAMIFSDQSPLSYFKSQEKIHTFFEHIQDGSTIRDFSEYQRNFIKDLIDIDIVEVIKESEIIKFKNEREINILYKLWRTGTYCLFYREESNLEAADQLVYKGFCEYTGKLFSEIEINYLSYILDDKKYGNGLKIRNKFAHGKFSYLKAEQHLQNYLELLQILIFYVIRINDELEYFANLTKQSSFNY